MLIRLGSVKKETKLCTFGFTTADSNPPKKLVFVNGSISFPKYCSHQVPGYSEATPANGRCPPAQPLENCNG